MEKEKKKFAFYDGYSNHSKKFFFLFPFSLSFFNLSLFFKNFFFLYIYYINTYTSVCTIMPSLLEKIILLATRTTVGTIACVLVGTLFICFVLFGKRDILTYSLFLY